MTYGLTEPFLLGENKRQLVMHGAKKDLKTETSTKKHDSVKRQSTVCCPHLQSHPACSSNRQLLPQTKWQSSSSAASQTLHPRQERGGDVNQRFFWPWWCFHACCRATRSSPRVNKGIILQAQLLPLLWLPFALPHCWGHMEISVCYKRTSWLLYFPLIIYAWIWLLPHIILFPCVLCSSDVFK